MNHSCPIAAFPVLALTAVLSPALAADVPEGDIVVTGTRASGVLASDSLAPMDILDSGDLAREGRPELIQALANALPAFNAQPVGFDLANETLAIRMRGLSPNHTLVLVNGKRLHGTANLAVLSGPYQGGAAPDLSFVPTQAVARIEVLKDGASAQYGSDAIAGVVNILLHKDKSGGSVTASRGGYYKGDGRTTDGAARLGLKLGNSGFIDIAGNVREHGFSNAGGPDQRVVRAVASGANPEYRQLPGYPRVNKVYGDARYSLQVVTVNAGMPVDGIGEVYAFGTYGRKKAGGWANFRLPQKLPALYPNGFSPIDWVIANDLSVTTGLRTSLAGWSLDAASTWGFNHNRVEVTGSANVDLFTDTGSTPTDFYNGNLDGSQWTVNLDASRELAIGLAGPAVLALGGEYRRESYTIAAGDAPSRYKAGSQSFPGFSLSDAGTLRRRVGAAYVDLSLPLASALQVSLAGRYEHYSDFGSAFVRKVSARYEVTPDWAVRGTFSNGFRAPTLAEARYSATNVQPNSAFVQLPPNSQAARLIGIDPLRPEKSSNLNLGVAGSPAPGVRLTLDAYQIKVRDRIVGSGTLYGTYAGALRSSAVNAAIVANGNTLEAVPFSGVNVFTNGIDTRTRGIDLAVMFRTPLGSGQLDWAVTANWNQTKVTRVRATPAVLAASGQQLFDKVAISTLETASPRFKASVATTYSAGRLVVNLRNTAYGPSSRFADPGDGQYYLDRIGTKLVTDLDVSVRVAAPVTLGIGANNLFDVLPDLVNQAGLAASAAAGNPAVEIYPAFSPLGINGGYYYVRLGIDF